MLESITLGRMLMPGVSRATWGAQHAQVRAASCTNILFRKKAKEHRKVGDVSSSPPATADVR